MPNVIFFLRVAEREKKNTPNPDTVNIHIICFL